MKVYSNAFFAMNTRFVYVLPNISDEQGKSINASIEAIVNKWEMRLSRFNPDADLFQLNQLARVDWVKTPDFLSEILQLCDDYHGKTEGLFDPTYASVYDVLKKDKHQDMTAIQSQCGWDQLEWNKTNKTIRFNSEYLQLDFGSIGKGIALKEVVQFLKSKAITCAFLSFGESSLAAIGSHPFGIGWPIAISESFTDSNLSLMDDCISISGMQDNGGSLQSHIYHPLKSKMVTRNEVVAIQGTCPIQTEIISTTIYMADQQERERLIKNFPEVNAFWERQQNQIQNEY
jgi:thiamine biosynthesis lipoprotein